MGDESTASTGTGYPPERHFLRDLDSATWQVTAQRVLMWAPLTDGYRNAGGSAALGFLAAMVDIAAAPVALIAGAPDWTATQDMSLHAAGWLTEGPAVVDARLERVGKNTVIVSVDIYDGGGTTDWDELSGAIDEGALELAAKGLLTFARIPRSASASASVFDPAALVGQRRTMAPDGPVEGTMLERTGVEVVDADGAVVEIPTASTCATASAPSTAACWERCSRPRPSGPTGPGGHRPADPLPLAGEDGTGAHVGLGVA